MEDFLRRIKLVDDMSTRLNVTKTEFISAMRNEIEESDINNIFSGIFEVFSSNKKKYKGIIDNNGFHIRKKRRLFKKQDFICNAKSTFKINGDILIINTIIYPFNFNKTLFMSALFACYIAFVLYKSKEDFEFLNELPPPFILLFALFIIMPYFLLRSNVSNFRQDLESHFFSISGEINHSK